MSNCLTRRKAKVWMLPSDAVRWGLSDDCSNYVYCRAYALIVTGRTAMEEAVLTELESTLLETEDDE